VYKSSLGKGNLKLCKSKGQILFKGEIITKNVKIGWGHLENQLLKNHKARKASIYTKAS
jgi:hypothetical protein